MNENYYNKSMLMRMFIAIDLSLAVKKIIAAQSEKWLKDIPKARITPEKNLHLTLRFLGPLNSEQIWETVQSLNEIAGEVKPFTIRGKEVAVFPAFDKARIIAAELSADSPLFLLSEKIRAQFDFLNLGQKEAKKFIPHLTLARLKTARALNYLAGRKINFFEKIDSFQLMESVLSGPAPAYQTIQNFKLCGK